MGRGNPLDDPQLEEIERLLDASELGEAERLLAVACQAPEHADAATYLRTRLLFLQGKLDARGVADRLRLLLSHVGYFPRAAVMLHEAETGHLARAHPVEFIPAHATSRPPQSDGRRDTPVQYAAGAPTERPAVRRKFTPVFGFGGLAGTVHGALPAENSWNDAAIPTAPALPRFETRSEPADPVDADFDALRAKSLLPADAGRYSEAPHRKERVVTPSPTKTKGVAHPHTSPPVTRSDPLKRRSTVSSAATSRRDPDAAPLLYDLATWIDQGEYLRAIDAVDRAGDAIHLDHALLRARALAGAGFERRAFEALAAVASSPLLTPELQAGCARLFVELGEPAQGLRLAADAMRIDPERASVRLTFALAAVRCSRRRFDVGLLRKADRVLETLRSGGPMQALALALRASIQAGIGDTERATTLAHSALSADEQSPDALAALAEAAARSGGREASLEAWRRLLESAPDEAEALAERLEAFGIVTGVAEEGDPQAPTIWNPVETILCQGDRTTAISEVEGLASQQVQGATRTARIDLPSLADAAANFLTTAPVLRVFGPFDRSFRSIKRLETGIDTLYGRAGRPSWTSNRRAMTALLGAYIGETLRLAYGGRWTESIGDLEESRVSAGSHEWQPFHLATSRIEQGGRAQQPSDSWLLPRDTSMKLRSVHVPPEATLPPPWHGGPWPNVREVRALGRSLCGSVISLFCEEYGLQPLDVSLASLTGVDAYLALVSSGEPDSAPRGEWLRVTSVLVGAYVGEVLCEASGCHWLDSASTPTHPAHYRLYIRKTEVRPVEYVYEHLLGRNAAGVADYARAVA